MIAGKGRQLPTAYSNYVLREMGRAETMLKVLGSPHVDASTLSAMLGGDGEAPADVDRLLALRATDGEGGGYAAAQDEAGGADPSSINAFFGAGRSNMLSMADTLKQQQAKTSEDLKALSKDMKKKLFSGLKRGT